MQQDIMQNQKVMHQTTANYCRVNESIWMNEWTNEGMYTVEIKFTLIHIHSITCTFCIKPHTHIYLHTSLLNIIK